MMTRFDQAAGPTFLPIDEGHRLAALERCAILDTAPEEAFDRVARLAAFAFRAPIALISFVDGRRQWFKARVGLDVTETPREVAFCAHAILNDEVCLVPDARMDARFADNPLVLGDPGVQFYAGAPLTTSEGLRLGTLCVIDRKPRDDFGAEDARRLADLAAVAMSELELRRRNLTLEREEAYFRELADAAPAMLWTANEAGGCDFFSRAWLEFAGPDREPPLGASWPDMVHEEDRPEAVAGIVRAFDARVPFAAEFRSRRHDGEYRWILDRGRPRWRADGGFAGYIGLCIDVTDRRRAEELLRRGEKLRAVGQIAGGVAHDFNNMLAVVIGNLDLLVEDLERGSGLRDRALAALGASRRGAELVHHLLAFARRQPLSPRPTDINELIQSVAPMLRGVLGSSIELRLTLAADAASAQIDPAQLEAALLSLTLNARDAMPEGGELSIETMNDELGPADVEDCDAEPGSYLRISVGDTGEGMAAEVRAQAFEPFFTTKAVGRGSGLGLSMVHGFVKQSGGHVRLLSEPGAGATVDLYLPKASRTDEASLAA
jgi:PAS domain S-box-containing protein